VQRLRRREPEPGTAPGARAGHGVVGRAGHGLVGRVVGRAGHGLVGRVVGRAGHGVVGRVPVVPAPSKPARVMPGAEPFSAPGGPRGALLVHGFCGSPFSMRRSAERLAAHGLSVEAPLLPGHGTVVEDLVPLGWADWSGAAEAAYTSLRARCPDVAVVGHSMGGAIACWLAERHPEIRGIAVVNPLVQPFDDEIRSGAKALVEAGTVLWSGAASDTADPEVTFPTYEGTPLAAFCSLNDGVEEVATALGQIRCPVLLISSRVDHVVPPANGDQLVASVRGPSARVWLERSYHNAMVDYDHEEVEDRIEEFVLRVTAPASEPVA